MSKRCTHDYPVSCKYCSMVKMVAYQINDNKVIWYSPFNTEKRNTGLDNIAKQMELRLKKKYANSIKKLMFFDNQKEDKPLFAEN